jgi:hypothetical protein
MSKAKEISSAIEELRRCSDVLAGIADSLTEVFTDADQAAPQEPKHEAIAVTLEQVRGVLAEKSLQGLRAGVQALIAKYGADKLSKVDPTHYASMLAEAEAL